MEGTAGEVGQEWGLARFVRLAKSLTFIRRQRRSLREFSTRQSHDEILISLFGGWVREQRGKLEAEPPVNGPLQKSRRERGLELRS